MNSVKRYQIRYHHFLNIPVLTKPKKILDIGCGTGEFTDEIASQNSKSSVTACDINMASLKLFKKRIYKKNIKILKGNAEKLEFPDNVFNCTFMFDVLEHTKNPNKVISEIKRVTKRGGTFHLVVPCEADLATVDGWIKKILNINLKRKPIGHIQQFTFNEIISLLQKAGFKIQRAKFSYYFLYQFFSLMYYAYSNIFNNGRYVELLDNGSKPQLKFLKPFIVVGGYLINLENTVFSSLGFRGQTAHITSLRI